jgi:hypothetical protein
MEKGKSRSQLTCLGCLGAVVVLGLGVTIGAYLGSRGSRVGEPGLAIVEGEVGANAEHTWQLGNLLDVKGSQIMIFPLHVRDPRGGYSSYSSSHSAMQTRNLLFVDSQSGSKRWLLPKTDQWVRDWSVLRPGQGISAERSGRSLFEPSSEQVQQEPVGVLYQITRDDSDGDGKWTAGDTFSLALSAVDGTGFTEILSGIDDVLGWKLLDDDRLVIYCVRSFIAYEAIASLSSAEILSQTKLPSVGEESAPPPTQDS